MIGGGQNDNLAPSENLPAKANNLDELLSSCPKNQVILDNLIRAWKIINNPKYKKIVCSISGGSDSDIMLDICWRCDKDNKIDYVWFDTGLEYQATKDHLKYLEEKYDIKICPYKAIKPIPLSCKIYGQPFISKHVSEMMQRLQRHNFQWEDEPFAILYERYPHCKVALQWWCNEHPELENRKSRFNIGFNKWLKEFILENNPPFKISNKCCTYAKKNVSHKLLSDNKYDLNCIGIRKSEGGARASAYKNCYDEDVDECDNYRPLFWYKEQDKKDYEDAYLIVHSKCYTEYGLLRTGCAGCPFGRDFEQELEAIKEHEPKLYKTVNNIFGGSYEYTRKYREFCEKKREELKSKSDEKMR